jgi:predicted amidohydrolase YtcJ
MKPLMKITTLLGLALSTLASAQLEAKTHVIHAGKVLTIPGNTPLSAQTIVIKDGIITAVKDGFIAVNKIDENAIYVDLSNSFVMPGLMDMHVQVS